MLKFSRIVTQQTNIDSRMLKWMLFNSECIFRNCMEYISMPFNLKIILAFSVHCEYCSSQNFGIGNAIFQSNWIQLNPIKSKKKYSLFKIFIQIKKNFNPF